MGENAPVPLTSGDVGGNIDTEERQEIHDPKTGKIIDNVPDRTDGYSYLSNYRLDLQGNRFDYPTIKLPDKELAETLTDIKSFYWDLYDGQPFSEYYNGFKTYLFENRGYDDFNIYDVKDDV